MNAQPTPLELLEVDLDCRLACQLDSLVRVNGNWNDDIVLRFMRAAYAMGFLDALTDPDPSAFLREHGYGMPERRAA